MKNVNKDVLSNDVEYETTINISLTFEELDESVKDFTKTINSLTIKEIEKKIKRIRELVNLINASPDDFIFVRSKRVI